jgi:hypothetical protein
MSGAFDLLRHDVVVCPVCIPLSKGKDAGSEKNSHHLSDPTATAELSSMIS